MAEGGESWDEVTYLKKKTPRAAEAKSKKALTQAMRKGEGIETTKKYDAGGNKQKTAVKDTARLDRETEELKHATVTLDFGKTLQQARMSKGLTQKELATKINEKPQVVNEYESGKAIPNQTIISKMERSLGIKLRGKDAGTPLGGKKK